MVFVTEFARVSFGFIILVVQLKKRRFRVVQVNRANAKGETALMHGAASGSIKIVRMLVKVK